jgi:endoglucanase
VRNYASFLHTTIAGTAVLLCAAISSAQTGYWRTSGASIVDSNNNPVRIAGINWYGFETTDQVVHGLWAQDYRAILNTIKSNGYNVVRLPFSNQMVEQPIVPGNISYNNSTGAINSDLRSLNALQIMDRVIAYAGQIGLRVILDNHRSNAGNSAQESGLWYTNEYPESAWIQDWTRLAQRYLNNPTVVGVDLRNEPHNSACWGCGSANDWRLAAQRAGNAVLGVNPNLLIVVEGIGCHNGSCTWWGGNLEGARDFPVVLNTPNRLVYSPHDYGPDLYVQQWFNGSTSYASLVSVWTKSWAYLSLNGIAPVWVGEFGTGNSNADVQNTAPGSQGQWFQSIIRFLRENHALGWTYWALNGEDAYALLNSGYNAVPVNALKQQALASIQSPSGGGGGCAAAPAPPTGLAASAVSSTQINLTWNAVVAPSGCVVTYNVYATTSSTVTATQSNLVASGLGSTAFSHTGLSASTGYNYVVTAVDSFGQSGPSNQAGAVTRPNTIQTPTAPSNLNATAMGSNQINLGWTASPTAGVTYNIYGSTAANFTPAPANRIASAVTGVSYTHGGLSPSTTYFYRVTAVNAGGESAPTNQANASTAGSTAGLSCQVTYLVNTQWNVGFNAALAVRNTGSSAINGWTLSWVWSGNQAIYQSWNSTFTQSGNAVTLRNASWNGNLASGASASGIGFNASYSGNNASPAAFYLNGVLCR